MRLYGSVLDRCVGVCGDGGGGWVGGGGVRVGRVVWCRSFRYFLLGLVGCLLGVMRLVRGASWG